jgi:hypothetical protein
MASWAASVEPGHDYDLTQREFPVCEGGGMEADEASFERILKVSRTFFLQTARGSVPSMTMSAK